MQKLTFTITAYVVFKQAIESEIKTNSPVEFTTYRWIVHPGIDDRRQLNRAYEVIGHDLYVGMAEMKNDEDCPLTELELEEVWG